MHAKMHSSRLWLFSMSDLSVSSTLSEHTLLLSHLFVMATEARAVCVCYFLFVEVGC